MPFAYLCTTTDPYYNLALEKYLASQTIDTTLMLWQNTSSVIIGRNQNVWAEVDTVYCQHKGITIARRESGGGAVYHDLGNLNYTIFAPRGTFDIQRQTGVIVQALGRLGIEAEQSGRNDILVGGRKVSGSAFSLGRTSIQHGTMLANVNVERMRRSLTPSALKLQAKGIASVRSRIANLCETHPEANIHSLIDAIYRAFCSEYGRTLLDPAPQHTDVEALRRRFADPDFIFNATPAFDVELQHRFDWGLLSLCFSIQKGVVQKTTCFSDALDPDMIQALPPLFEGRAYPREISSALKGSVLACADDIQAWLEQALV